MSPTPPPLAAMISAIRSIAGRRVASPTRLVVRTALSSAIPAASRTRAISSATRTGEAVASSQGRPGRRTSPPSSWSSPRPSTLPIWSPRGPRLPAARRPARTLGRQSRWPSTPTPVASQRSCQVFPGYSSICGRSWPSTQPTTADDAPIAAASSARPSPTTLPPASPRSESSVGPFLVALSANTSELLKSPGQDWWPVLEPHKILQGLVWLDDGGRWQPVRLNRKLVGQWAGGSTRRSFSGAGFLRSPRLRGGGVRRRR